MRPLLAYAAGELVDAPVRRRRCRGRRGRARPRLFAHPRRSPLHGRRRAAPRQADVPRRVRRGDGAPRRRRAAGARVRRARRRAGCTDPAGACALLAEASGVRGMAGGQAVDLAQRGRDAVAGRARDDAPDEDGRADPRLGAAGRGAAAGRSTAGEVARARCLCRRGGARVPGRSTTCSTWKARRHRSARRPARTSRRASRRSSRASGSPRPRERAEALRVEARAALAPFGGAARRLARARRLDRAAQALMTPMYPLLDTDRLARRRCAVSTAAALPRARARAAGVRAGFGRADRRPPVVEPRHDRAHDRAPLRVRHAARSHRVGRRPPDLRAQDPDRAAART